MTISDILFNIILFGAFLYFFLFTYVILTMKRNNKTERKHHPNTNLFK